MDQTHGSGLLVLPLLLLAVAVISVPLGRLLRLSPIVAYVAAGVVVGPFGLALVRERETVVAVSERGVVLLLVLDVSDDTSFITRAGAEDGITILPSKERARQEFMLDQVG